MWRALAVPLRRVKSIVFACMILHNLCIDAGISDGAPAEPAAGKKLPVVKRAEKEYRDYVQEMLATYGMVLSDEAERESSSKTWSKTKLEKRTNTQSKMRDALAHAVEEANLVRPASSSYSYSKS